MKPMDMATKAHFDAADMAQWTQMVTGLKVRRSA